MIIDKTHNKTETYKAASFEIICVEKIKIQVRKQKGKKLECREIMSGQYPA